MEKIENGLISFIFSEMFIVLFNPILAHKNDFRRLVSSDSPCKNLNRSSADLSEQRSSVEIF